MRKLHDTSPPNRPSTESQGQVRVGAAGATCARSQACIQSHESASAAGAAARRRPQAHQGDEQLQKIRDRIRLLKAVWKDPRTPWHAKAVLAATVAYAISPIDLIPDFIPVLGHLDDLVIVPLGFWIAYRLVPREVWLEHRQRIEAQAEAPADGQGAQSGKASGQPTGGHSEELTAPGGGQPTGPR